MKIWYKANFWPRCRILEVKKMEIIRILLGIHFWGLNCKIVDLICLKFDNNKEEEEEEKEDNNDREGEEDNNNKENNDIKEEEEEAPRAKRRPQGSKVGPKGPKEARRAPWRPEGPHTWSWAPEVP